MSSTAVRKAIGSWRVEPWGPDPARTLITYRVQLDTAWWIPWFTKRFAARQGLPTVTRLIGRRAEANP